MAGKSLENVSRLWPLRSFKELIQRPHPFMKTLLSILACVAAIAVTVSFTGCGRAIGAESSGAGKPCTVQFRRDALGAAASLPISPTTGSINGAETAISGRYVGTREDWVIVSRGEHEVWIPRSVILLIEF